jgi:hypothetical protein
MKKAAGFEHVPAGRAVYQAEKDTYPQEKQASASCLFRIKSEHQQPKTADHKH